MSSAKLLIFFVTIIFGSSLLAMSNYAFIENDEQLKGVQAEPIQADAALSGFDNFLAAVKKIAEHDVLQNKFVLLSSPLGGKTNFLDDDKLSIARNAIVTEILSDQQYRFSLWITKLIRVANIDEVDGNTDFSIVDILDPKVYNCVLSCNGTTCTGEVLLRENQGTWSKQMSLTHDEIEKFKLDLRKVFWIFN
jgi:hypothetical protein